MKIFKNKRMNYNYHTQGQNYGTGQANQGIPQPQQQNTQFNQQQTQPQPNQRPNGLTDPFFNFGNQGFNMDIREDFNDPFANMGMGNRVGVFGFPDIAAIERQMLGHFQNQMQSMQQLSDGMMQNMNNMNNNQQMTTGEPGQGGQRGLFISMQSGGSGPGTMISKTYCSKIDYSGGQPKEESYQSQAIKQFGEGGHSISEQQEAYKNTMTGVQKAAHQRLLDDKGTKLIKQRNINTGEQSEHNILKGMQESEVSGFNKQYNDYREKVHFQDNYKYLNSLNPGKMVKQLGQGKGQGQQNNLLLGDGNNFGQNQNNFGQNQNNFGQNQNNFGQNQNNFGQNQNNFRNNTNNYQPGNQYSTTNQAYNNPPQFQNQNNAYNQYNRSNYKKGY